MFMTKRIKIAVGLLTGLALAALVIYYFVTRPFADTADLRPDYTVDALPFVAEFEGNPAVANKKYSEKIIVVRGRVSALEKADTLINIKMTHPKSGSYIIFSFQPGESGKLASVKAGDSVSIKGSCSNGTYSEILSNYFIGFKRCSLLP